MNDYSGRPLNLGALGARHLAKVMIALSAALVGAVGCTATLERQSPQAVIAAKFDAVNRHAVTDIENLYTVDAIVTSPDFCGPRRGRPEVHRNYENLFSTFPDITADVQEYIVQGDRVAVRLVVRGQAAGSRFEVPIFDFFTVRNGLIVSDDGLFDARGRKCTP
jgi:ketosteroid isomerase-like protein